MPRRPHEPKPNEITPEALYLRRREFIKNGALFLATAAGVGGALVALSSDRKPDAPEPTAGPGLAAPPEPQVPEAAGEPTSPAGATHASPRPSGTAAPSTTASAPASPRKGDARVAQEASTTPSASPKIYRVNEDLTPYEDVTTYNNFYEFGTDKSDPAANAHTLKTRPWSVVIDGEVGKPQTVDIDTLLKWFPLEERVYRMRCVEAWSMVIPWLGFPLGELLKRVEPTSKAKYVAFTTLADPEQMPGIKRAVLDWPYIEGLRLDEAMHPLAMLATGLYGKPLPNQNGAPLRLVVPWKYGFKGIKSIVRIRLTAAQPPTSWNVAAPDEYGFYANVNPAVDHPRWSQATERRIGEFRRRPTLAFNGYAEEVAILYRGMDLRKFY